MPATITAAAFGSAVIVNAVTALVFILLFALFRDRYHHFYCTLLEKRCVRPTTCCAWQHPACFCGCPCRPPPKRRISFGWFKYMFSLSDDEFIERAGLDAYMFIHFVVMNLKLFSAIGVLGCAILVPIHAVVGDLDQSGLDRLSMSTIADSQRRLLWVHWVTVYAFSAYALWLLYDYSREVHTPFLRSSVRRCTALVAFPVICEKW